MPRISRRNYALAQMFVFYERLKKDGYEELYKAADDGFIQVSNEVAKIIDSSTVIRQIGEAEARKEQNLLRKIFNVDIEVNFNDKSSVKDFIDTLNDCLGLKKVYERNKFLITNSNGMKSVISYFPTYFLRVWNRERDQIFNEIKVAINGLEEHDEILGVIYNIVHPRIEEMIPIAIEEMFRAERELKNQMPEEMKDAYLDLLSMIGKVKQGGSLAHRISEIYNLDTISEVLTKSVMKQNAKSTIDTKIRKTVKTRMAQKGGLTLEAIEGTVYNLLINNMKIPNGHVYVSGKKETGFKADNILSINIDPSEIQQALETEEATSRERNKKLFEDLGERLKNIKDGYIVYSSAKNYVYNEGFKRRGGFSAESISLDSYRTIMKYTNRNARTFTGAILQTAEGAIKGPSERKDLEKAMAQDIAYFLFDDFKTIGDETKAGDTQAIHLMDLNGILIPLSFFLISFAKAIEEGVGHPEDFVKVGISVPPILWFTAEEQSAWQQRNNASAMDAWVEQRAEALAKSRIEVHFLREFKDIISTYLN